MPNHVKQFYWLILSIVILVIDQWTKFLVVKYLTFSKPYPLLPFLNLMLVHNSGAAFSFLGTAGGWQRWFFIVIAIILCGVIFRWLLGIQHKFPSFALALILGGALGNLCDRLRLAYVRDFIDFHLGSWHFATFNIADSAITIGVIGLIISFLFLNRQTKQ